jgi:hypothetical protein
MLPDEKPLMCDPLWLGEKEWLGAENEWLPL